MKSSRRRWLVCATVIVVGSIAGLAIRLAFQAAGVRITLASELEPSDPRYKDVMCGPASLSNALGLLGISQLPADVAAQCRVTAEGVALSELQRFANNTGVVKARSEKLHWDDFVRLKCVAVLFVDGNHFLAADSRATAQNASTMAKVQVYEQEIPSRWLSREELEQRWDGTALVITKAAAAGEASGPRIEWDKCLIDLGVLKDQHAEYQFALRNTGNSELTIGEVQLSCGCADYTVSKDRLGPGESAQLKVNVDLSAKEGHLHQHAIVKTNDAIRPLSVLRLTGGVPRKRAVSCDAMRLEDVPQGGTVSREFYVADPEFSGCKIRDVQFAVRDIDTDEHLSCSIALESIDGNVPNLDIPAGFRTGRDYRVRLSFAADAACPTGPFAGDITVAVEADDNVATHKVAIFGAIVPSVRPVPRVALITLGPEPENVGSATIQLHGHSNREINVVRMWSDQTTALKVRLNDANQHARSNSYVITAHMPQAAIGMPPFKGMVSFELDNGTVVSVPVTVFRPPG